MFFLCLVQSDSAESPGATVGRPATVSELAAPFDMHSLVRAAPLVLEQSRLVKSKKRGRVRTYEIAPERFKVAEDWLTARVSCGKRDWTGSTNTSRQLKEKESKS
jgi:hypothetical protein